MGDIQRKGRKSDLRLISDSCAERTGKIGCDCFDIFNSYPQIVAALSQVIWGYCRIKDFLETITLPKVDHLGKSGNSHSAALILPRVTKFSCPN